MEEVARSEDILLRMFEKGSEEYDPAVENIPDIGGDGKAILKLFPTRMRQVGSRWRNIIDSAPLSSQMQFRISYISLGFPYRSFDHRGRSVFKSSLGLHQEAPRIVDILSQFRRDLAYSPNCDLAIKFEYMGYGYDPTSFSLETLSQLSRSRTNYSTSLAGLPLRVRLREYYMSLFIQGMRLLLPFRSQVRNIIINVPYARPLREVLTTLRSLDPIPNLTSLTIRSKLYMLTSDLSELPPSSDSLWPSHQHKAPPTAMSSRYPNLWRLNIPGILWILDKEMTLPSGLVTCVAPDGHCYANALLCLAHLLTSCTSLESYHRLESVLQGPVSLYARKLELHVDSANALKGFPFGLCLSFPRLQELSLSSPLPEALIPALSLFVDTNIRVLNIFISLLFSATPQTAHTEDVLRDITLADLKTVLGGLRPEKLILGHTVNGPVNRAIFTILEFMNLASLLSLTVDISHSKIPGFLIKRCHYFYGRKSIYIESQSLTHLKLVGIPESRLFDYTAELITPNLVDVTINFLKPSLEVRAGTGSDDPNHPLVQHTVPSVRRLEVVSSIDRVMSTVPFLNQLFPGVESVVLKSYRDTKAERRYSLDIGKQCDLVSFHLSPAEHGTAFPKLVTLRAIFVGTHSVKKGDDYLRRNLKGLLNARALHGCANMSIKRLDLVTDPPCFDDPNAGKVLEIGATLDFLAE